MNRTALILALSFLLQNELQSQLKWTEVTTEFGPLPASVKVFKSVDSIGGKPSIAFYVEADLKDKSLQFTSETGNGKRYTPSQFYATQDSPLLVVNTTFFSFQTNQSLNTVIKDGNLVAYNVTALRKKGTDSFYYPTRSAIGISRKRRADIAWLFTDTAQQYAYAFQRDPVVAAGKNPDPALKDLKTMDKWKWWRVQTAVGGGPVLVHNGNIRVTSREEHMFVNGENDRHPRTAMGYTRDRKLIILSVQGRSPGIAEGVTLHQEAAMLQQLGCEEALNLDGGGSSAMIVNGKATITPSDKGKERPVPAVFLIKRKDR